MMTASNPLVTAWLDRVRLLSAELPPADRAELLADLEDHLSVALPPGVSDQETAAVLARLGDPADIVGAAGGDTWLGAPAGPAPSAAGDRATTGPGREGLTLGLLVVAGLTVVVWPVAVVVWIAAVVLLVTRTRWRGGEVVVALLVPIGTAMAVLAPLAGFVVVGSTCVSVDGGPEVCDGASGLAAALPLGAFALLLAATVTAAVWLLRRVRDRPV